MSFNLKRFFARGPEIINAEQVFVREIPVQELGMTLLYVIFAGIWCVFSDDVFDWLMHNPQQTPALQTMRGVNFVITTGVVLYFVLRRTFRTSRTAREALRLSQERFESAALATTDAIWDLNLETKVFWWSDGMQKIFGYTADEVSPNFDWWHQRVHPEDRDRVVDSIRKVVEGGGRTWTGEYRFRRHNGTYATVMDRGYIIPDASGKPTRLVGGLSDISERRLAEKALERSRQQLRALTARLQSGREEERARVAREIHDDLGQVLTALKLELDWLEREIGKEPGNERVNRLLDHAVEGQELVANAIDSVQRIATDLRPAMLDNLGLAEALREEGRRFQERSGTKCDLQLPPEPFDLPSETAIAIFRVFQEALTNVARHAQASSVDVRLDRRAGQIILHVEDNGRGIPTEALDDPNALGLIGMSERAAALGGRLAVAPAMPQGTRVTLQVPDKKAPTGNN